MEPVIFKVRQYSTHENPVACRLRVEYNPNGGPHCCPWVRIDKIAGCAPDPGVVLPILLLLRDENGAFVVKREKRNGKIYLPVPNRWLATPLGTWGRTGRDSAYWGHAWALAPDGHRWGRWVASWHTSRYNRLNEPIEGDPWVLAHWVAAKAAAEAASVNIRFDIRIETKPVLLNKTDTEVSFIEDLLIRPDWC